MNRHADMRPWLYPGPRPNVGKIVLPLRGRWGGDEAFPWARGPGLTRLLPSGQCGVRANFTNIGMKPMGVGTMAALRAEKYVRGRETSITDAERCGRACGRNEWEWVGNDRYFLRNGFFCNFTKNIEN